MVFDHTAWFQRETLNHLTSSALRRDGAAQLMPGVSTHFRLRVAATAPGEAAIWLFKMQREANVQLNIQVLYKPLNKPAKPLLRWPNPWR